MEPKTPENLEHRTYLIDGYDLNTEGRTGSYVMLGDKLTIVETSASPSVPYILDGLKQLNLDPLDVEYIIVTHIHLDHAGGAGLLLNDCPNAKVVVHSRGKRHLADPSKLIAGARAVYGEKFDGLFNPIVPIPEEKLIVMEDGEGLAISDDCTLTFYDSPGHAKHHFSIFDPVSNGIFAGDTAGIFYHQLLDDGLEFYIPSTSPNQFDPDAMLNSIEKFEEIGPERIYFGHYGMSENPQEVYKQMRFWIPEFVEAGESGMEKAGSASMEEATAAVYERLYEKVSSHLTDKGIPESHRVYDLIKLDLEVSAMGLADYLMKKGK
ncbi:MBL fold metallo-hydrolase [Bacillus marinisedimentorum]|uniref:MBL fold metallo-hydrolase n=1 Tax=Bacillus marinisedimentorum TaxID=1821260 RepID=UPI0008724991|nr:MBL fold metallo-hydrolase [Bacillus marinisedimentorum]